FRSELVGAKAIELPDRSGEQSNKRAMPKPSDRGMRIAEREIKLVPKQMERNRELDDLAPRIRVGVQVRDEREQASAENGEKNNQPPEIVTDETNDRGRSDQRGDEGKVVNQALDSGD